MTNEEKEFLNSAYLMTETFPRAPARGPIGQMVELCRKLDEENWLLKVNGTSTSKEVPDDG